MTKMPDLQTFESPVRVQGERAIGSYDLSPLARGNAAMQAGVETLGKGIQAVGTDLSETAKANDQYSYAIAKASNSIDNQNAVDALKHDPDYATHSASYMLQAQANQSRWADTISNPALRARFNAETGATIAASNSQVADRAFALQGRTQTVDMDDRGKLASDQAAADPTDHKKLADAMKNYGDIADGLVATGVLTPTEAAAKKDAYVRSLGDAHAIGLINGGFPQQAINEARAVPGSPEAITNRIMMNEGAGKDPRSSAVGGFIDSTWLDLVRKNRPDLAAGKSDADILALRADPGLRKEMTAAYANQNSAYLKGQGLEATPGNQYLAHFLGPGGAAAMLKANPKAPVADVLAAAVGPDKARAMIDANPTVLQGKLAGSVSDWANGKMGGAIPGAGSPFDWMDEGQKQRIIARAEDQLETNKSNQNSQLKLRMDDTLGEMARTGYATNPMTQSEFVASKGLIDGPKLYAQYLAQAQTYADVSNVTRMTAAQQDELIKSYEPKPGEGYEVAAERQDQVKKAVAISRKELGFDQNGQWRSDADPAKFAINRIPAVKAAFTNFDQVSRDPTATPEAKSLAARDYVNKTTERQIASGVAPGDVKVVPATYVDGLDKAVTQVATSEDPQARQGLIARINNEKKVWGDVWPSVMGQLPEKTTQPIVRAIAAGANPIAMSRLLALPPKENPVAILKEQNEVTARNMNNAVNTAMADWRSTLVGPQQEAYYSGYNGLVSKLAALYVRDGKNAVAAADAAYNAVIGDRYEIRDTWRVPKDPHIDANAVQLGTLMARQQLGRVPGDIDLAGFRPNLEAADRELKLSPEEKALYSRHLANLTGAGGVDNPDGSRSTLYQAVQQHDVESRLPDGKTMTTGRSFNIPTVWNGKIETEKWTRPEDGKTFDVPNKTALANVEREGWDKFPSYATTDEADARYEAMHAFMEKDTSQYFDLRNAAQAARSGPFGSLRLQVNDMGISDNEADSRRNFARNGTFVTSKKEDGLNVAYGSGFVSDKDDKRILLSWDQLAKMGGSPEATTAAFIGGLREAGGVQ